MDGKNYPQFQSANPGNFPEVNYNFIANKDGKFAWRPYELIHPAIYVSLINVICEPGNWEFRSTATLPMSDESKTRVSTRCIRESEMSPDAFLKGTNCTASDVETDDDSMSWKMSCANPMGPTEGEGRLRSSGDSIRGQITMSMLVHGRPMKIERKTEGKRLGPCE